MIPLVGVSTYVADARWGGWERQAAVLPETYFELVAAAGGRPLLLPPPRSAPGGPEAGADEVVAVLDGLVLTGGGDVAPDAYGEEPVPEVAGVDPVRDDSERALLDAALRVDMPVLAICRGCQVLNVQLGGTLHQHLPDEVGHLAHRTAPYVFGDVDVETVPGTLAADVFGDTPPSAARTTRRSTSSVAAWSHRHDVGRGHRGGRAAVGSLRPRGAVASRAGLGPSALRRAGRAAGTTASSGRCAGAHDPALPVPVTPTVAGQVAVVTGASRGSVRGWRRTSPGRACISGCAHATGRRWSPGPGRPLTTAAVESERPVSPPST